MEAIEDFIGYIDFFFVWLCRKKFFTGAVGEEKGSVIFPCKGNNIFIIGA